MFESLLGMGRGDRDCYINDHLRRLDPARITVTRIEISEPLFLAMWREVQPDGDPCNKDFMCVAANTGPEGDWEGDNPRRAFIYKHDYSYYIFTLRNVAYAS